MKYFKHSLLPIALVLSYLSFANAQTEDTAIDVLTGNDAVQFVAHGDVQHLKIDIYSANGDWIFDDESFGSDLIAWDMRDAWGRSVPNGVYLSTISVETSTGIQTKRFEQIIIERESTSASPSETLQAASVPITGTGNATKNKLVRFTGPSTVGNSIVTQRPGRIGINGTPTAVLDVTKKQPGSNTGDGKDATTLLQTSGGKGGNTTGAGTIGGKGASIALYAGEGGDAFPGSTNGDGGHVVLQPGSSGSGGNAGVAGNVLLAPFAGNVGIGTTSPMRALQIGPSFDAAFTIEPSDGSPRAGFIRFGDGTGWQLRIGRSRESSAGPLNTGLTGSLVTITDSGAFHLTGFPLGLTGVQPLCRTLSNAITMCESSASSLRYKSDPEPYRSGLDIISRLQPIAFTRKQTGKRDVGLAAEDVEAIEPMLTFRNENGEVDGVRYELLSVPFINAINEQQEQLRRQNSLIDELQARLARLERLNGELYQAD